MQTNDLVLGVIARDYGRDERFDGIDLIPALLPVTQADLYRKVFRFAQRSVTPIAGVATITWIFTPPKGELWDIFYVVFRNNDVAVGVVVRGTLVLPNDFTTEICKFSMSVSSEDYLIGKNSHVYTVDGEYASENVLVDGNQGMSVKFTFTPQGVGWDGTSQHKFAMILRVLPVARSFELTLPTTEIVP